MGGKVLLLGTVVCFLFHLDLSLEILVEAKADKIGYIGIFLQFYIKTYITVLISNKWIKTPRENSETMSEYKVWDCCDLTECGR